MCKTHLRRSLAYLRRRMGCFLQRLERCLSVQQSPQTVQQRYCRWRIHSQLFRCNRPRDNQKKLADCSPSVQCDNEKVVAKPSSWGEHFKLPVLPFTVYRDLRTDEPLPL